MNGDVGIHPRSKTVWFPNRVKQPLRRKEILHCSVDALLLNIFPITEDQPKTDILALNQDVRSV
jgi:hypothetical protein